MFRCLLIANRGEIACRVAATARRLGIRTVAVYSDADAGSAHVAACDEAVRIGPPAAVDSYLHVERILAAARASGAQAIHPGYGFLSENAAFASACGAAGITFVGPPAEAIRAMGDKREAKRLMQQAAVPLIPGYEGSDEDLAELKRQAARIGFPVLIKAAQGGGGRGIRVVNAAAEFEPALVACRREALAAFADDRVLLERYLPAARHIEVQVFADRHGGCVYLHERDCSAQRRHQKVIEEAPAPGLDDAQRRRLGEAAVAAARAVSYVGAGTVEFLLVAGGRFYFMEMNTRLQVEHPVTEMITGQDLVEWQLRVAAGEPLPLSQAQIGAHGHSFEARIYAEDPERDFLPATGRIAHLALPAHVAFARHAADATGPDPAPVRIDAALRSGDEVTSYYDAMVAKLIVWGPDRAAALTALREALAQVQLVGPANNVDFLHRLASSRDFADTHIDTGWIGRELAALLAPDPQAQDLLLTAACARVLAEETGAESANPWSQRRGWRLNGIGTRRLSLRSGRQEHEVGVEYRPEGIVLVLAPGRLELRIDRAEPTRLALRVAGAAVLADVIRDGEALHVFAGGHHQRFVPVDPMARAGAEEAGEDRLCAPMPGKVIALHAAVGQAVARGQALMVIEAMKMEHTIIAPHDGVVEEVRYRVGDQVAEGATLIALGEAGAAPAAAAAGQA
jgi:3-methylcrotonyl-CoA carboxylase alpha subunit